MSDAKVWDRDSIIQLLNSNDKAVERALVRLYHRQTASEQSAGMTKDHNGRGFGAYDAEIFTKFAEWVIRGRSLSPKMLAVCRKVNKRGVMRIGAYWRQLIEEIENGAKPVVKTVEATVIAPMTLPPIKSVKDLTIFANETAQEAAAIAEDEFADGEIDMIAAAKAERGIRPAWGEW